MAQEGQLAYIPRPRPSIAARWSKRGSGSPSDMDMTRSWIMSAAAEQSRPFLIKYDETIVPDFSPDFRTCYIPSGYLVRTFWTSVTSLVYC
jgi:hypothetical protein